MRAAWSLLRYRVDTPQHDYDGTLAAIAGLVARLERETGKRRARSGVGIPGSVRASTGTGEERQLDVAERAAVSGRHEQPAAGTRGAGGERCQLPGGVGGDGWRGARDWAWYSR